MTLRRLADAAPPWSFFVPVLLAVALGVLLADGARWALSGLFGGGDVSVAAAPVATGNDPRADAFLVDELDDAHVEVGEVHAGETLMLPGPSTAMRDGAARACINGTVALQQPNGWVQGLEHNAPLRCRATSP